MLLRNPVRFLSVLLLLALVGFYVSRHPEPQHTAQTVLVTPEEPKVTLDEYGLDITGLRMTEGKIERAQTFSEILSPHGVPAEKIFALVETAEPVFDIRTMQAGKRYRVYSENGTARYLIYKQDDINYIVFDMGGAMRVYEGERPVSIEERTIAGTITSSLYETLSSAGADPELAGKLAEVYAWQIDFYRIQKGDGFKVVFEQEMIDGRPIGVGNILAANFRHYDQDYLAFRFEQNGAVDYFDAEGESLRKAFLKSPLKFSRMTSGYTMRRFHPVQKRWKAHLGTDYAAPKGTPIMSTGDGVVLEAQFKRNNGNYVKIRHNGTYTTGYLHMSRIAPGIRPGAKVTQGQLIGYVGSTGLATGPHVCYRFWKKGTQVDHLAEKFPSANPVKDEYRMAFEMARNQFLPALSPTSRVDHPALAALGTPAAAPTL